MSSQSIDMLVAEYAAGSLARPAKVLVDAHLEIMPESRQWLQDLEEVAGQSLDTGPEEPIKNSAAMISAIFDAPEEDKTPKGVKPDHSYQSDDWMPAALRQFVGLSTKEIPWRMKIPGVYTYKMDDVDGCEITFLRIKPGVSIPTHTHEGRELALVLKGSFDDGEGHYARGDVSVADGDVDHKPTAGMSEECICLIVTDAPVRFTGPFARMISSILPR